MVIDRVNVKRYSEADLPTSIGSFRCLVYRSTSTESGREEEIEEHVALVRGNVANTPSVLARIHSQCFTSEVLGSLRCDCRDQLNAALERIDVEGTGVLVYLFQEGRGIGLGNKIRAYELQDKGVDTVEANLALGFDADLRSYEIAAAIFDDLGVRSVRLMTNNPIKIRELETAGIEVAAQEPHWMPENSYNSHYLSVKRTKMGHILPPR